MKVDQPDEKASYIQIVLDGMIVNASIFQSLSHIDTACNSICRDLGIVNRPLQKPDAGSVVDNVF